MNTKEKPASNHQHPHPDTSSLSPQEAAALAGVSAETIRRWIDDALLPARRDERGALRIDRAQLQQFLRSRGPEQRMLTIRDVAERENVSVNTVRRWIKSGKLPATQLRDEEAMLSDQAPGSYQIYYADYRHFVLEHQNTVAAVARRMHRHPNTIRRWLRSGRIGGYKINTYWIITDPFIRTLLPATSDPDTDSGSS